MNSLLICLNAIVPIFLIIAVGYAAKRANIIRENEVPRMNAVAFKVFMPVMCFYNVYTSDLSSAVRPMLMTSPVAFICVPSELFASANLSNGKRGIFVTT